MNGKEAFITNLENVNRRPYDNITSVFAAIMRASLEHDEPLPKAFSSDLCLDLVNVHGMHGEDCVAIFLHENGTFMATLYKNGLHNMSKMLVYQSTLCSTYRVILIVAVEPYRWRVAVFNNNTLPDNLRQTIPDIKDIGND